jgi:hypothetical protein
MVTCQKLNPFGTGLAKAYYAQRNPSTKASTWSRGGGVSTLPLRFRAFFHLATSHLWVYTMGGYQHLNLAEVVFVAFGLAGN